MSAINQAVYLFVVHHVICLQSSCSLICCVPCHMFAINQAVYLFVVRHVMCLHAINQAVSLLMCALDLLLFLTGTTEWPVTATLTDETQLCVCVCACVCA